MLVPNQVLPNILDHTQRNAERMQQLYHMQLAYWGSTCSCCTCWPWKAVSVVCVQQYAVSKVRYRYPKTEQFLWLSRKRKKNSLESLNELMKIAQTYHSLKMPKKGQTLRPWCWPTTARKLSPVRKGKYMGGYIILVGQNWEGKLGHHNAQYCCCLGCSSWATLKCWQSLEKRIEKTEGWRSHQNARCDAGA